MNQQPVRRRTSLGSAALIAITIALALITLLSLEPFPFLPEGVRSGIAESGQIIVQLVTVVGAMAVIIGVLNLLGVHLRKLSQRSASALYSLITIVTLLALLVLHVLERFGILKLSTAAGAAPPDTSTISLTLMDAVQVVIESALAGLLFFFLVFAAYRLMRRRVTVWGVLFVGALVIVLMGYTAQPDSFLSKLRDWLLHVPVGAGIRGLLIGVAIGTVVIGARVLIGQDRTFRE
jgi:hypothetical protein